MKIQSVAKIWVTGDNNQRQSLSALSGDSNKFGSSTPNGYGVNRYRGTKIIGRGALLP